MKYLLDTDHASILQMAQGSAFDALVANISAHDDDDVGISIISFHEQVMGCNAFINRGRGPEQILKGYDLLRRVLRDYASATLVAYDAIAADAFGTLRAAGIRIGTMDLRIASIALCRQLVVVTSNARDFSQVPGLTIEDWTR